MLKAVRNAGRKLNEYFFDVEESESTDYVGATLFYGACGAGLVVSACLTVFMLI